MLLFCLYISCLRVVGMIEKLDDDFFFKAACFYKNILCIYLYFIHTFTIFDLIIYFIHILYILNCFIFYLTVLLFKLTFEKQKTISMKVKRADVSVPFCILFLFLVGNSQHTAHSLPQDTDVILARSVIIDVNRS